jgi:hypothetical protein
MSVPAKRSTSAAQKHEGELYLAMKAAVPQSQKRTFGAPPQEATKERPFAMGSKTVAGSAVEDTNLKPVSLPAWLESVQDGKNLHCYALPD